MEFVVPKKLQHGPDLMFVVVPRQQMKNHLKLCTIHLCKIGKQKNKQNINVGAIKFSILVELTTFNFAQICSFELHHTRRQVVAHNSTFITILFIPHRFHSLLIFNIKPLFCCITFDWLDEMVAHIRTLNIVSHNYSQIPTHKSIYVSYVFYWELFFTKHDARLKLKHNASSK